MILFLHFANINLPVRAWAGPFSRLRKAVLLKRKEVIEMAQKGVRRRKGLFFGRRDLALLLGSIVILGIISFPNLSTASEYPTKSIQIIVPFPPGGDTDTTARLLANKLSVLLGQPVVVINKPGAGSTIGIMAVKASPADGHTILAAQTVMVLAPLLAKNIPFNLQDFVPVSLAVTGPNILAVRKEAPWMTMEDLIADAKKNPGKLTYAAPGYGSTGHFAGELFKTTTATNIACVAFDGQAPATTAVLGGHVDIVFTTFAGAFSLMKAGTLRALVAMGTRRSKHFPDVPTTVDKGYAKLVSVAFHAYYVPAKTPKGVVNRLERAFKDALSDKDVAGVLENGGWDVEKLGTEETVRFLAEEQQKWAEVARVAGIKPK
jgi:tripartite-type tricarboxylate transporter receptor subunit TctC